VYSFASVNYLSHYNDENSKTGKFAANTQFVCHKEVESDSLAKEQLKQR
jgi:hypothetical protein